MGQGIHERSVHLLLNFTMNLKLLQNIKSYMAGPLGPVGRHHNFNPKAEDPQGSGWITVEELGEDFAFADGFHTVDKVGVEPTELVLEDQCLYLSSDTVAEGNCAEEVPQNSHGVTEKNFVPCPPIYFCQPYCHHNSSLAFNAATSSANLNTVATIP